MKESTQSRLVLETTAYTMEQLITLDSVQIALAGRSNVGKSSLVNALAGRKSLAKTSATPGKTRSVNYYHVEPEDFYVVDLPGYGYAKCSKTERDAWGKLMQRYLVGCHALKALVILLDCRLPPQKLDLQLVSFAQNHGIPLLPILTKADKCKQKERSDRQKEWSKHLNGVMPLVTSSASRLGLEALWQALRDVASTAKEEGVLEETMVDVIVSEAGEKDVD